MSAAGMKREWCTAPLCKQFVEEKYCVKCTDYRKAKAKIDYRHELFNHMANEHGVKLLDSELDEIILLARKVRVKK